jgi:hypothetical protein
VLAAVGEATRPPGKATGGVEEAVAAVDRAVEATGAAAAAMGAAVGTLGNPTRALGKATRAVDEAADAVGRATRATGRTVVAVGDAVKASRGPIAAMGKAVDATPMPSQRLPEPTRRPDGAVDRPYRPISRRDGASSPFGRLASRLHRAVDGADRPTHGEEHAHPRARPGHGRAFMGRSTRPTASETVADRTSTASTALPTPWVASPTRRRGRFPGEIEPARRVAKKISKK